MKKEYKYYAFISYSHKDSELAKWLQHEFEYYKLPSVVNGRKLEDYKDLPDSFRPLFRDEDELAGGDLKPQILEALCNSQYLIVVCSPSAAQSKYVNAEIKEFINLSEDNRRKIFPFIVEGKPHQDNENFDLECFPEELRLLSEDESDPVELIAGDVNATGKDHAFVKILAGTIKEKDIKFSDLWNRYEVEKAEKERKEREQRDKLLITQSHYLAEKSVLCHEQGDNFLAQLLALEALPHNLSDLNERPFVLEAEDALRRSCSTRSTRLRGHLAKINCIAISSNGNFIASSSDDKTIKIWNVENGKILHSINVEWSDSIVGLFFSHDNRFLISHSSDRDYDFRFWKLDDHLHYTPEEYTPKIGESISTLNGDFFMVHQDGKISGNRVRSNVLKTIKDEYPKDSIYINNEPTAIYVNKNVVFSATKDNDKQVELFSFSCKIRKIKCFTKKLIAVCIGDNRHVYLLDLINKTVLWEYDKCVGAISDVALDPQQKFIAISCYDKSIHILWVNKYPLDRKFWRYKQLQVLGDDIIVHNESGILCVSLLNMTGGYLYEGEVNDYYFDESQFMLYIRSKGDDKTSIIDLNSHETVFATSIFASNIKHELDLPRGLYIKDNKSFVYNDNKKISVIIGNEIRTICETNYSFGGVMMSPTLDYVLVVICTKIYIIDSKSFNIIEIIEECRKQITSIDISSDGNLVVFGSQDAPIILWDKIKNETIKFNSYAISSSLDFVAFVPDNRKIISAFQDNSIIIFEINEKKDQIKVLHNLRHQTMDYYMHNFSKRAISPNGKYLLVGHHKGLPGLDVIDIDKGCKVASFDTYDLCVRTACFTEENNQIVTELEDGSFLIYDFPELQDLIDITSQKFIDRPFSKEEKDRFHLN